MLTVCRIRLDCRQVCWVLDHLLPSISEYLHAPARFWVPLVRGCRPVERVTVCDEGTREGKRPVAACLFLDVGGCCWVFGSVRPLPARIPQISECQRTATGSCGRNSNEKSPQTFYGCGLHGLQGKTLELRMVPKRRLELPRELPHSDLNAARLPIPPRPHCLGLVAGI